MKNSKTKVLSLSILVLLIAPFVTNAGISIKDLDFEALYITGGNSGILKSLDEGQTWIEIGPNLVVNDLVVENDNLFAATNNGVYRKLSNGSWGLISPNSWSTNLISKNNNYLLAAVGSTIRFTNNPEAPSVSWNLATINLSAGYSIKKFWQLETVGNYAYAIAKGLNCSQQNGGIVCFPINIYLGSNDGGQTWQFLFDIHSKWLYNACLAINPSNPFIYAYGGFDGIRVMNWDKQISDEYRWAVNDCRFIGQNLVIGSFDAFYGAHYGLQYSPDYGQTWYQSNLIDKKVYKIAQNRVNNFFYAIGQKVENSSDLKLYKFDLLNIIDSKDYQYGIPKEMILSSYIP
jgi:hypothetical protein